MIFAQGTINNGFVSFSSKCPHIRARPSPSVHCSIRTYVRTTFQKYQARRSYCYLPPTLPLALPTPVVLHNMPSTTPLRDHRTRPRETVLLSLKRSGPASGERTATGPADKQDTKNVRFSRSRQGTRHKPPAKAQSRKGVCLSVCFRVRSRDPEDPYRGRRYFFTATTKEKRGVRGN